MLKISPMNRADIPFAARLTQIEKWAYATTDIARLHDFEPAGYFIARYQGRRVGMVSTTSYGDYASLGMLIVRKSVRSLGFGEALMRAAIDYLHGKGVRTIELDGVFRAAPLYRRLGFVDKFLSLRMYNPRARGRDRRLQPAQKFVDEIIRFDKDTTGIARERVIHRLLKDYPDSYCIIKKKRITAYAVAKRRMTGIISIGPFVAENKKTAETLLSSLLARFPGRQIAIGVPEINRDAVELLLKTGFVHLEPCIRMYLGRRRTCEKNVYGIISPEKG